MFRVSGEFYVNATSAKESSLAVLPKEVLVVIFQILEDSKEYPALFACALTCKAIGQLINTHCVQFCLFHNFVVYMGAVKRGAVLLQKRGTFNIDRAFTPAMQGESRLGLVGYVQQRDYSQLLLVDPHRQKNALITLQNAPNRDPSSQFTEGFFIAPRRLLVIKGSASSASMVFFSLTEEGLELEKEFFFPPNFCYDPDCYYVAETNTLIMPYSGFIDQEKPGVLFVISKSYFIKLDKDRLENSGICSPLPSTSLTHNLPWNYGAGGDASVKALTGGKLIDIFENPKWKIALCEDKFLCAPKGAKKAEEWAEIPFGNHPRGKGKQNRGNLPFAHLAGDYFLFFDANDRSKHLPKFFVCHLLSLKVLHCGDFPIPLAEGEVAIACQFIKKERELTLGLLTEKSTVDSKFSLNFYEVGI